MRCKCQKGGDDKDMTLEKDELLKLVKETLGGNTTVTVERID